MYVIDKGFAWKTSHLIVQNLEIIVQEDEFEKSH